MKGFFTILALFLIVAGYSQAKLELMPAGFEAFEFDRQGRTNEEIIDASKIWASEYRHEQPSVFEVTTNSLKISAQRNNAFFYRNVGEEFYCEIKYIMAVSFTETRVRITFTVTDIYERNVRKELQLSDYFTSDGKIKSDFRDVKPSLERTVSNIINSYISYISG